MKKTILVILVALGILALSPLLVKGMAKSKLEDIVQNIDNIPGYKAKLVDYKGGYYTATANLNILIDADQADLSSLPEKGKEVLDYFKDGLTFDLKLSLGPIIIDPSFKLGLANVNLKLKNQEQKQFR